MGRSGPPGRVVLLSNHKCYIHKHGLLHRWLYVCGGDLRPHCCAAITQNTNALGTCRRQLFIEPPAKCHRGEVTHILVSCQQPLKHPVSQVWNQSQRLFRFHGLIYTDKFTFTLFSMDVCGNSNLANTTLYVESHC